MLFDKLEELGCVDDRIWDRGFFDQLFLSELGAKYPRMECSGSDCRGAARRSVPTPTTRHDGPRQRQPRTGAGCCCGREEVRRGCLFERGRVRDVNEDCCPREHFRDALAGDRVDARVWRCGYGLVPVLAKHLHELRADEPRAADNHDLHVATSVLRSNSHFSRTRTAHPCPSQETPRTWPSRCCSRFCPRRARRRDPRRTSRQARRYQRPALHLHFDRPLQHVDESVGVVAMDRIRRTSWVLNHNHR